jgi:hypothetical protein
VGTPAHLATTWFDTADSIRGDWLRVTISSDLEQSWT